jgi:hypothetical protein
VIGETIASAAIAIPAIANGARLPRRILLPLVVVPVRRPLSLRPADHITAISGNGPRHSSV